MANNILAILKKRGKNPAWLSRASGIGPPQLSRIMSGKVEYPLVITGIKIRETNTPGKGARFEVLVIPGNHRIVRQHG